MDLSLVLPVINMSDGGVSSDYIRKPPLAWTQNKSRPDTSMAADRSHRQAVLWFLAFILIFTLQGTDAQTNTTTTGVPGWGIALLVLTALTLASLLCCLICLPLVYKYFGQDSQTFKT
ncbi:uncharacterized protein LOC143809459 [Ranitomeya variabilis]|uniref:uncharacterized protein LOC143809459 n=1 Tax=Ranitomeya variabilis TaxID=490064 RepID=UPI0040572EB1